MRVHSIFALVLLAGCPEENSNIATSCPCSDGYVCCPADDMCVPEGESCGEPVDARSLGGACKALTDYGLDQTIDSEQRFTYGERSESSELDDGLDGVVDSTSLTLFDDQGRFTSFTYDEVDGEYDVIMNQTYDQLGRRSVYEEIWTDHPEYDRRRTFAYSGPQPIEQQDRGRDGSIERITTVVLDEQQRPIRRETDIIDASGIFDGVPDSIIEYEYGSAGLVRQTNHNAEGAATFEVTYEYDAAGHLVLESWDLEADGAIDERDRYTYDAQGRMLTAVVEDALDPSFSYAVTYQFDCE